ncbi:MAG: divalent-cation tolerance protein CutA [Gemmatimonadota bacterium]
MDHPGRPRPTSITTPRELVLDEHCSNQDQPRLAACVQTTAPITAVYRWDGKIWNEPEWQVWIITAADKRDGVAKYLDEHHSGEVPELIFLPIADGAPAYLNWITGETR